MVECPHCHGHFDHVEPLSEPTEIASPLALEQSGVLQEVNRWQFHPLGLELARIACTQCEASGRHCGRCDGSGEDPEYFAVFDHRDTGIFFTEINWKAVREVTRLRTEHFENVRQCRGLKTPVQCIRKPDL